MNNYTIQELRALHILSKPELMRALAGTDAVLKTEPMSVKTKMVIQGLSDACKSYSKVIDKLFAEIDRLNGMQAEKGAEG